MNGIEFLGKPTVVASATHNGARNKPNEDRYDAFIAPGGNGQPAQFLTVADGVTSSHGGERASDIAVRVLKQSLSAASPQPLRQRMVAAIVAANREILDTARQDTELRGMSTTLVLAAIDQGQLHVMFLGDSRAYLLRNGKAHALTRDHTWVQEAVDEGRITVEQARTHPNKHVIQRYLGDTRPLNIGQTVVDPDLPAPDPDKTEVSGGEQRFTNVLTLRAGDAVLLCSDGLYNRISDQEIGTAVADMSAERAVKSLIDTAVKRQEADNITIVLWTSAEKKALAVGPLLRKPAFAIAAASTLIVLAIVFLLWQISRPAAPENAAPPTPTAVAQQAVAELPDAAAPPAATETPTTVETPTATITATSEDQPTVAAQQQLLSTATATVAQIATAEPPTSTPVGQTGTATPTPTLSLAGEVDSAGDAVSDAASGILTDTGAQSATEGLIEAPSPTQTATPTPLAASVGEQATSTRIPTVTPIPTATNSPTRTPTHTPRPTDAPVSGTAIPATGTHTPPGVAGDEGGPRSVTLILPPDATNSNAPLAFSWRPDTELLPGQVFELVFWRPSETINDGRSPTEATTNTTITTNPGPILGTGDYRWGVWLGKRDAAGVYRRIRPLAAKEFAFTAPQVGNDPKTPGAPPPVETRPPK